MPRRALSVRDCAKVTDRLAFLLRGGGSGADSLPDDLQAHLSLADRPSTIIEVMRYCRCRDISSSDGGRTPGTRSLTPGVQPRMCDAHSCSTGILLP